MTVSVCCDLLRFVFDDSGDIVGPFGVLKNRNRSNLRFMGLGRTGAVTICVCFCVSTL